MAYIQYLNFDGENFPLPDSYEVDMEDKETDSGGETEAGTIQRDVVRAGGCDDCRFVFRDSEMAEEADGI